MPICCVPDCQSQSRQRSDDEKILSFVVPKNRDLRELWTKAINREELKDHHRVCSKHFTKSDILYERKLIHNGRLLGVSPYVKPQLREGAVPTALEISSQMPKECNSENLLSINPVETLQNLLQKAITNTAPSTTTTTNDDNQTHSDITMYIIPDTSSNDKLDSYYIVVDSDSIDGQNDNFSFENLLNSAISLPIGWTKCNYNYEDAEIVVFSKTIIKNIHNNIGTINMKEILVNCNLIMKINVFHNLVNTDMLKLDKHMKSLRMLENTIRFIDSLNVCQGCNVPDELKQIVNETTFIDCTNTLRYKNCHLLTQSIQCQSCHQGEHTLARKYSKQKDETVVKRMYLNKKTQRLKKILQY